MQIQRVVLEGVGPLGDVDTTFQAQGINLVLGPNESGKSTLCEAMVAILYGFGPRGESANRRSWHRTERDPYAGTLWIESDGALYTVRRKFASDQVHLTRQRPDGSEEMLVEGLANPRGRTDESRANCKALRDALCLPSEDLLRASTYVGQLAAEVKLDDELRQQISGAGQSDYRRADAALAAQYYDLTAAPLPGDRRRSQARSIENLQAEIEDLRARKREAEGMVAQLSEVQEQLDLYRQRHDDLKDQLEPLQREAQALSDYLDRLKERAALDVEAERVQRHAERRERCTERVRDSEQQLAAPELVMLGALSADQLRSLERYVTSGVEPDLQRLEALYERLHQCEQRLADSRLQPMAQAPEDAAELLERLQRSRVQIERLADEVHAGRPAGKPTVAMALAAMVLGILGLFAGLVAGALPGSPEALGAAGLLVGVIAGAALGWLIGRSRDGATTAKARVRLEAANEDLADVSRRLAPLLGTAPDVRSEVLAERLQEWRRIAAEANDVRREIAAIEQREALNVSRDPELRPLLALGSQALEDRLQRYRAAVQALDQARAWLSVTEAEPLPPPTDGARRADLVAALEALERRYPTFVTHRADPDTGLKRLEALRLTIEAIGTPLRTAAECIREFELCVAELRGARAEDPTYLADCIERARQQLERLLLKRGALALAIQVLRQAVVQYQEEHLQRLSEMIGHYFAQFTLSYPRQDQPRYAGVHIGEDQRIEVLRATGEALPPDQLSVGARDQLYLALRLAVADLLAQDMPLPLLLDDAFVNFDSERREAALEVLTRIAADRQVVLLSHDESYAGWAQQVTRLPNGQTVTC